MQSITTEEYDATCKWLKSKIDVYGESVSINDVKIPLEWILELVEKSQLTISEQVIIQPTMTTKEFVAVSVKECIDFANYLDYLGLDEFDSDVIVQALESSKNPDAKRALDFMYKSSHDDVCKLFNKILKKLANYEYDD